MLTDPKWLSYARGKIGEREIKGPRHNHVDRKRTGQVEGLVVERRDAVVRHSSWRGHSCPRDIPVLSHLVILYGLCRAMAAP